MKIKNFRFSASGGLLIGVFIFWTILVQIVDVQSIGVNGTSVGFAELNSRFHSLTGVNMTLYNITDWAGLVPVFICMIFGIFGFVQFVKRKSLLKVDFDIIISGIYYAAVIFFYLIFEMIPVNYRPILINGIAEASYPSSTTLLVLSVMPSYVFLINNRAKNQIVKKINYIITVLFSVFVVGGRLICGVHWLTDIAGSVFLSLGMFLIYKGIVLTKRNR